MIGRVEQGIGVGTIFRITGKADRRRQVDQRVRRPGQCGEWFGHALLDLFAHARCRVAAFDLMQQYDKFIATITAHNITRA